MMHRSMESRVWWTKIVCNKCRVWWASHIIKPCKKNRWKSWNNNNNHSNRNSNSNNNSSISSNKIWFISPNNRINSRIFKLLEHRMIWWTTRWAVWWITLTWFNNLWNCFNRTLRWFHQCFRTVRCHRCLNSSNSLQWMYWLD